MLALEFNMPVSKFSPTASAYMMLALDQGSSQRYFGTDLVPYWARAGASAVDMLALASASALDLKDAAASFDSELYTAHSKVGSKYADLTSLVYRQTTGAIEKTWNPLLNETW